MSTQAEKLAAIEALKEKTPEALVEAARDKNHPLHNDFDWNNTTAAHKWRLDQARTIFVSIRITNRIERISSIGYVRDPRAAPNEQGYVSTAVLRDDTVYAQEALDAEISRIQSLMERAKEFAIMVNLLPEFEEALKALVRLHSKSRKQPAENRAQA